MLALDLSGTCREYTYRRQVRRGTPLDWQFFLIVQCGQIAPPRDQQSGLVTAPFLGVIIRVLNRAGKRQYRPIQEEWHKQCLRE